MKEPIESIYFVGKDTKSQVAFLLHRIVSIMMKFERDGRVDEYQINMLHDDIYMLLEKDKL